MNKRGFSLLEVILASIVFLVVASVFLLTLNKMREPVNDNDRALEAAQFGRAVMEEIRRDIAANTWDDGRADNPISLGTHFRVDAATGRYNAVWTISNVTDPADPAFGTRRIDMGVKWLNAVSP